VSFLLYTHTTRSSENSRLVAAARFAGHDHPSCRMASASSEDLRHHLHELENEAGPLTNMAYAISSKATSWGTSQLGIRKSRQRYGIVMV